MLKRPQAARLLAVDREAHGTRLLLLKRGMALRQAEIDWCNEALASLGYVRSMRR